jgi:hypothetical protein
MRLIVYIFIVTNITSSIVGFTVSPELPIQAAAKPAKEGLAGEIPCPFSLNGNDSMPAQIKNDGDQGQKVFQVMFSGEDVEAVFKYTDARGNPTIKMLKGTCYFTVSRFTYGSVVEGELVYILAPESKDRVVKALQIEGANRSVDDSSFPGKVILPGALASLADDEIPDQLMCPDPYIKIITGRATLAYDEKSYILIRKGIDLKLEEKVFSRNDPAFNKMLCSWVWTLRIQDRIIYQAFHLVDEMNSQLSSQAKSKG